MRQPDGGETQPTGSFTHHPGKEDTDDILPVIDEIIAANPEEFLKTYVEKGAQGWNDLIDPSFYVGSAAATLAIGMSKHAYQRIAARFTNSLRELPGHTPRVYNPDGSLDSQFTQQLEAAWEAAKNVAQGGAPQHTIEEAVAFHWTLFSMELQRAGHLVALSPEHYERIAQAAGSSPMKLSPSQLVAKIVDDWLDEEPNT